jgi:hypothetical protein
LQHQREAEEELEFGRGAFVAAIRRVFMQPAAGDVLELAGNDLATLAVSADGNRPPVAIAADGGRLGIGLSAGNDEGIGNVIDRYDGRVSGGDFIAADGPEFFLCCVNKMSIFFKIYWLFISKY